MNNKAQAAIVGTLILTAVGLIVGLVLLSDSISDNAAQLTTKHDVLNQSITLPAIGLYVDIDGCVNSGGNLTSLLVNRTDGVAIDATNYTYTTRVSPTNSLKVLTIKSNGGSYAGLVVNASYTCLPQGYAEDAGARAVIPLIVLFSAVALVAFALVPVLRNGVIELVTG